MKIIKQIQLDKKEGYQPYIIIFFVHLGLSLKTDNHGKKNGYKRNQA
jgi:hypothetical protein